MTQHDDTPTAAPHWDIPVGILIPHTDIAEIWDTCLTCVGYWAAEAGGVHGDPGAYSIREREPNAADGLVYFTGRDIATAAARIIAGRIPIDPAIRHDIIRGDYDATAADCIVQVAAFGEIVYG